MKLVVFDLDQMLVDLISVHDELTHHLFQELFNVDARLGEVDFAGRSLADNFTELAKLKGVPSDVFLSKKAELLDKYDKSFHEYVPPNAEWFVLPGARALLAELKVRSHILALYTGDSPGIINSVFQATGLGSYFASVVHGAEAETRGGLLRLAVARGEALARRSFGGREVVVIGDSVRDIDAGKEIGAVTVAVATGFHTQEMLGKHDPDYVFKDLSNYRQVLAAIERSAWHAHKKPIR